MLNNKIFNFFVSETTIYDTAFTIGGKKKKDVAVTSYGQTSTEVDCDAVADAPFITQGSIAIRDKDGRPMVCGGAKNPDQKSCAIYDATTNTWSEGPSMKRKRNGASATCLENGICWVFGGKR